MPDMPTGQLIRLYRIDRKKSTTNVATPGYMIEIPPGYRRAHAP